MDRSQHALEQWLEGHIDKWQRLEECLRSAQKERRLDAASAGDLITGFRGLTRDLSLAREVMPDARITRYLEALFMRTHEIIDRRPHNVGWTLKQVYSRDVPHLINNIRSALTASVGIFVLSLLTGWVLVHNNPELTALFASQEMIDTVQRGQLWTDDLFNIIPSSLLAFSLITNNVTVTLFAFSLGALYGLGTLYIIGLNGLMLGGAFAFTGHHGLDGRLFEFVIAHGLLELSVICLAGALGIQLGEALIRPGTRTRLAAFQDAVSQSGTIIASVGIPSLMVAGIVEGYISPHPDISFVARTVLGFALGGLFWLLLGGKLVNPKRRKQD